MYELAAQTNLVMPEWLARRAQAAPQALAAIGGETAWTFTDLDREATITAGRLAHLGVTPGDRIALLMGNGLPFVAVVHAATRLGAILVPLNIRLTATELAWQLADVRATLLLHDDQQAALAGQIAGELPQLRRVEWEETPPAPGALGADTNGESPSPLAPLPSGERGTGSRLAPPLGRGTGSRLAPPLPTWERGLGGEGDRRATATEAVSSIWAVEVKYLDLSCVQSIIYTSGTTGKPKGVMLTYGNHWWSAMGSALNLGNQADDRWLLLLPMFHVGGLAIMMRSVIYGVPAIVHARFDPEAANDAIDRQGVTLVSVVATMLDRMLTARADRPYPSSLRAVLLGGGPAPRPLLERCARIGVPVVQTYGMTETASQAVTLAPSDALRRLGSAGQPLLPMELRIEHEGAVLAPDMIGEIVVRGPSVTPGYADRPEATAAALRDGWLHTGDLGYLDAEGYLYVVDRRDDLIISGGENIYPAEVEAVLLAHPAVAEAGVFGLPDAQWGQRVVAAVVFHPGMVADTEELSAFCAERLARYKAPGHILPMASLPRNAAGKLLRRMLRDTWVG